MPYLRWKYKNGLGDTIVRDNPSDFMDAAQAMYRAITRFRLGDPDAPRYGIRVGTGQTGPDGSP